MEMLSIEVYNDANNVSVCHFRKLHVDAIKRSILLVFDEELQGAAGKFIQPFTMLADNTTQVPVYRKLADETLEPVLDEDDQQVYIGEFNMWETLIFQNAMVSINNALTTAINRRKGLTNDPLIFVDPFA